MIKPLRWSLERRALVLVGATMVVVGALVVLSLAGQFSASNADRQADRYRDAVIANQKLVVSMFKQRTALYGFMYSADPGQLGTYRLGRLETADAVNRLQEPTGDTTVSLLAIDTVAKAMAWERWAEATKAQTEVTGARPGDHPAMAEGTQLFTAYQDSEESLSRRLDSDVSASVDAARRRQIVQIAVTTAAGALLLLTAFLLGRLYVASILRPITRLSMAARALAEGRPADLDMKPSSDEITELAAALRAWRATTEALEHNALHDALTGLPNRLLLLDRAEHALAEHRRSGAGFAFVLMDLDGFKEVNDTFGHQAGDELLAEVGQRLNRSMRGTDTVCRLGGDEFALLVSNIDDGNSAQAVIAKAMQAVERPIYVGGRPFAVTISAGIALCPEHAENSSELMRMADSAMYVAKRSGSGIAFYEQTLDEGGERRLDLAAGIRLAVERNELELLYQPKFRLETGRMAGAEALLRWRHPVQGLLLPDAFLPLAERTGLVRAVGLWTVARGLEFARRAWRVDPTFNLAINLSVGNLQDPTFMAAVHLLLQPGDRLMNITFELTESAVMSDHVRSIQVLGELRGLGFRIAIDDFGTGHSSLAYLQQLPVDELKIDRTFITRMSEKDGDARIVRAAVELAHGFGMQVVAEGVEDAKTTDLLRQMGCDTAQGYHLGRPTSADDVLERIAPDHEARGPARIRSGRSA